MEYTRDSYVGNGSTSIYSITFDFLSNSEIKAAINGTLTTSFVFVSSNQIQFLTAPANGATVDIFRETDDTQLAATLSQGSTIRSSDLNENFNQAINLIQEVSSDTIATFGQVSDSLTILDGDIAAATATANAALPKAGGTMTGAIVLPADPSTSLQAATKQYVDAVGAGAAGLALLKTGGTMTGNLVFAAGQPTATTSTKNIVQLTDSASSTSTTTAATPAAVKVAKDAADAAQSTATTANTTANAALPKAGGTMTGAIVFAGAQQQATLIDYGITLLTDSVISTSTASAATPNSVRAAYDVAISATNTATAALPKSGGTMTGNLEIGTAGSLTFEGATADGFETTLAVVDPTADRTITLPNVTGTVVTTGDFGTITSTMIANSTITDDDISGGASIADFKLGTITAAGKVSNSATTATSALGANTIVARDGSNNFTAGTITAALTGAASANVLKAGDTMTGPLVTPAGTVTANGIQVGTGTTYKPGIYSPGADQLAISTSGTGRVFVNAAGLVDISNTTSDKLTLSYPGFGIGTFGVDSTGSLLFKADEANTQASSVIQFKIDGGEKLRIDASGNLGLGGVPSAWGSPQKAIEFSGGSSLSFNTGAPQWYLNSNCYYNGTNWIYKTTAVANQFLGNAAGGGFIWNNAASGTAGNAITFTQAMTLDASGRLRIGTGSPGEILDVSATTAVARLTSSTGTNRCHSTFVNTGGTAYVGLEGSAGGVLSVGTAPYALTMAHAGAYPINFATNNTLRATIDSSGRLLVGTSSSSANTRAIFVGYAGVTTDQGIIHLQNGGSASIASGATLGSLRFTNSSESVGGIINCDADATWTSGSSQPTRLTFSTTADGAASPTERMRIDSSGNVGIGATPVAWGANFKALQVAPWTSLVGNNNNGAVHLTCNAYYAGSGGGTLTYIGTGGATSYTQLPGSHFWSIASSGTAGTAITFTQAMTLDSSGRWYVGTSTDGGAGGLTIYPVGSGAGSAAIGVWNKTNTALEAAAQFRVSGTTIGSISYSNTLVAYNTTSDYRLKENVTPITNGITRFQQLKPSQFNFIVEPDKTVEGFLAHEAQAVVPECVTGEKDAVDADGNPVYQGIDQSKLVPLLTAALQEAIARIETLETRLSALEGA